MPPIPQTEITKEAYNGVFLERAGIHAGDLVKALLDEPTDPLDEEDKQKALAFEGNLAETILSDGSTIEKALATQKDSDVIMPFFSVDALMSQKLLAEDFDIPQFADRQEAESWLRQQLSVGVPGVKMRRLAKASMNHFNDMMIQRLVAGEAGEEMAVPQQVVVEPAMLISQSKSMNETRQYLVGKRQELSNKAVGLEGAQRAIVDVYLARINSQIAKNLVMLDELRVQADELGDMTTVSDIDSIVSPTFRQAFSNPETRDSVLQRLDFLRNGMADHREGGGTGVSPFLETVAHEVSDSGEKRIVEPRFNTFETERLMSYVVQPEEAKEVMRRVIERAGLLSQYKPDESAVLRSDRPKDGLFQVIVDPTKQSYSVNGDQGLYKVSSVPVSLYKFLVVSGAHEPEHINQSQADRALGEQLKIAKIKGKRVAMLRESGANRIEREFEKKLFGVEKPFALTYARALSTLESGGDYFDAAKAFYEEKIKVFPDIQPETAAKEAADRTLRLLNFGCSSQAMAYAEEAIMQHEIRDLPSDAQARATAITGLDLVDQVRLHRFGLLPQSVGERIEWTNIVLDETQELIDKAVAHE